MRVGEKEVGVVFLYFFLVVFFLSLEVISESSWLGVWCVDRVVRSEFEELVLI